MKAVRPLVGELRVLRGIHLDAARMAARGATWAKVARESNVNGWTMARWRKSKLFMDKIAEFKAAERLEERDAEKTVKKSPRTIARELLEDAIVKAAQTIINNLDRGSDLQQVEIAKEILKLTGHYAGEKAGQIVINIGAEDLREMRQGAVQMGMIEVGADTRHALPAPSEATT